MLNYEDLFQCYQFLILSQFSLLFFLCVLYFFVHSFFILHILCITYLLISIFCLSFCITNLYYMIFCPLYCNHFLSLVLQSYSVLKFYITFSFLNICITFSDLLTFVLHFCHYIIILCFNFEYIFCSFYYIFCQWILVLHLMNETYWGTCFFFKNNYLYFGKGKTENCNSHKMYFLLLVKPVAVFTEHMFVLRC